MPTGVFCGPAVGEFQSGALAGSHKGRAEEDLATPKAELTAHSR